jgi:predicted small lipoprotein YifL
MHTVIRSLALCTALAVSLAGCGDKKPDAAGNAQAAGDTATLVKPRPGHWDVKLQMTDFDVPGMPDEIKKTIGKQFSQAGAMATCLTPEQAARNDESFSMANGQIAAKLICERGPTKQTVDMRGTYGAEAYDLTLNSQGEMNGQPMKMTMQVSGKRTGECTGKEPS